jgi:hypothetical protein
MRGKGGLTSFWLFLFAVHSDLFSEHSFTEHLPPHRPAPNVGLAKRVGGPLWAKLSEPWDLPLSLKIPSIDDGEWMKGYLSYNINWLLSEQSVLGEGMRRKARNGGEMETERSSWMDQLNKQQSWGVKINAWYILGDNSTLNLFKGLCFCFCSCFFTLSLATWFWLWVLEGQGPCRFLHSL